MAERLTDEQVDSLIAILRKDVPIDTKVQYVTAVKSAIKQHNVPESCVAPLFDALRAASSSQHSALVNAGFTALNHLITRLSRQEPRYLVKEAKHTLSLIVEKMGDQKDKVRALAMQAMGTMYIHVPVDAERFVRNNAMVGKNPRAKEAEDADGMVRDAAKSTVIDLFRDAPNAAKSDLKKQLKNFKVRPAIEQAIVKELAPTGGVKRELESRPESALSSRPNFSASVSSMASERPITPMPETKPDPVEPSYVNTQRELDDIFKDMFQWFEGRETEQNWLKREESVTKLRRLNAGNASSDFPDAFVAGCRSLLDGILKAVNSLRTSLSKEACNLVQDLANTFGPGIDPMVELLMQSFVKLCAATKKIASQQANATVDTIIGRTTYNNRIMQHVWGACQDKNVQPRSYAAGWLKTLIRKEAYHKNHIEHSGGLDLIEKGIKKGLNDANPGVREKMRSTYWTFATVWPTRAEVPIKLGVITSVYNIYHSSEARYTNPAGDNVIPRCIASLKQNAPSSPPKPSVTAASPRPVVPTEEDNTVMPESATPTTPKPLKVYEDPFTAEEAQQPTPNDSIVDRPVLEDKPVNETTANLSRAPAEPNASPIAPSSPEKARQNSRLLDSGIVRVKAQTLDVHGFRKLQSLIRGDGTGSSKSSPAPPPFTDDKFDALLVGLFAYLESPLDGLSPEKVQDVKAQVLATIKLLLKKHQDRFQPHIARGLEALLAARARYQARTHIVSGLELLADELVAIGDAAEILATMTRSLEKLGLDGDGTAINGNNNNNSSQCRSLSMGLHILRQLIELHGGAAAAADSTTTAFVPTDTEVAGLTALCARCLESAESAVRMDAVQLCVALHARLGEARFWDAMRDVREDPKSLITYYVVKRQRERGEGPVA
ncbi:putative heat repeat containing protein [Eutypa lata UCREL1]|uniref:Putative heat repeat containing protein n=1 Tax=Eutypa lata (strain UCR-EL1) TaxID=1287681 RepID=M7SSG7_EUTLA|nr:putative heat repeat containing protein [Eutypa lata UCREL1]